MFCHCFLALLCIVGVKGTVLNDDSLLQEFEDEFETLRDLVKDLESRLEDNERTNSDYADRIEEAEHIIKGYANDHKVNRRAYTEAQVAFYAKLSGSLHGLSPHQTVIFDELVTNTSSSLYDTSTGIFTPPTSGMYVISWTANVNHQENQATELMVNGRAQAWAYADTAGSGDGDYGSASQTVVLQVNRNDKVWVRTGTNGKGDVHGADYSTFSAFLLFPHS